MPRRPRKPPQTGRACTGGAGGRPAPGGPAPGGGGGGGGPGAPPPGPAPRAPPHPRGGRTRRGGRRGRGRPPRAVLAGGWPCQRFASPHRPPAEQRRWPLVGQRRVHPREVEPVMLRQLCHQRGAVTLVKRRNSEPRWQPPPLREVVLVGSRRAAELLQR